MAALALLVAKLLESLALVAAAFLIHAIVLNLLGSYFYPNITFSRLVFMGFVIAIFGVKQRHFRLPRFLNEFLDKLNLVGLAFLALIVASWFLPALLWPLPAAYDWYAPSEFVACTLTSDILHLPVPCT